MPNGWGEPTLYDFTAQVVVNRRVVDQERDCALVSAVLVNEKDEHGESYYFEVNGLPLLAKEADSIPQDPLLPGGRKRERSTGASCSIREANMNVIRV